MREPLHQIDDGVPDVRQRPQRGRCRADISIGPMPTNGSRIGSSATGRCSPMRRRPGRSSLRFEQLQDFLCPNHEQLQGTGAASTGDSITRSSRSSPGRRIVNIKQTATFYPDLADLTISQSVRDAGHHRRRPQVRPECRQHRRRSREYRQDVEGPQGGQGQGEQLRVDRRERPLLRRTAERELPQLEVGDARRGGRPMGYSTTTWGFWNTR